MKITVNYTTDKYTLDRLIKQELGPYYKTSTIYHIFELINERVSIGSLEIFPGIILPHIKITEEINNHLIITVMNEQLQNYQPSITVVVMIIINENSYLPQEMELIENLMYKLADEENCKQLKRATSTNQIIEIIGENYVS